MSSGLRPPNANAFRNLDVPLGEVQHRRLRLELMGEVTRLIRARDLSKADAARLFGVKQPRIKDLMAGKEELFSLDALAQMLEHVGVRVTFKPKRPKGA
jgi:predicted XRE-type DNA-binding protein